MASNRVRVSCLLAAGTVALAAAVASPTGPAIPGADAVPIGWNSWNAFGCDISADRIKAQADALVSTGMRDAGWRYIVVDDCWVAPERDPDGGLVADESRFPGGIKPLADYVHARGLRFGLYTGASTQTCAQAFGGYPGARARPAMRPKMQPLSPPGGSTSSRTTGAASARMPTRRRRARRRPLPPSATGFGRRGVRWP